MKHVIIAGAILWLLAAAPAPVGQVCTCEQAKTVNGWCGGCNVGYVAGLTVKSKDLFGVLHTHGHPANPEAMLCEWCRKALEVDGFCQRCGVGFVNRELYFSKPAYYLAKGKPVEAKMIECPVCRTHVGRHRHQETQTSLPGWCDTCKVGFFGNLLFADRTEFEEASRELELLVRAVETAQRCEMCATAMLTRGRCPACNIDYTDGWPGKGAMPHSAEGR